MLQEEYKDNAENIDLYKNEQRHFDQHRWARWQKKKQMLVADDTSHICCYLDVVGIAKNELISILVCPE